MDVNYWGYVHAARAAAPLLAATGGRVVVVSSQYAKMAAPYQAGYAASKWALGGFFATLREELRPRGVGVTVHYPGGVATEVQTKFERAGSSGATGSATVRHVALEMPAAFLAAAGDCARHVWWAHDRGLAEAHYPPYVQALHAVRALWPEGVDRGFHAMVRFYFEQLGVMRFGEEDAEA
jgi:NAD(P)-dependent dehydrogenase (short-subunit alcohol dehydrogenase family)